MDEERLTKLGDGCEPVRDQPVSGWRMWPCGHVVASRAEVLGHGERCEPVVDSWPVGEARRARAGRRLVCSRWQLEEVDELAARRAAR